MPLALMTHDRATTQNFAFSPKKPKRRVNPGLGFGAFATAQRTIQGYEAMHMLRKGQIEGIAKGDVLAQNRVINHMFGLAA
jgi:transposase, IS6 family